MKSAPWLSLVLVSVLASVASIAERDEGWASTTVDGLHVLEGDIHAHTILAGALPTPVDVALLARRQRLDFVAVVEHNSIAGAFATAAAASVLAPEVIVVPSEEITTKGYHAHAVGISRAIDARLSLEAVADETRRQGGVLVAAHPVKRFWPFLSPLAAKGKIDGVEMIHPVSVLDSDERKEDGSGWRGRGRDLRAFWVEASERRGRPLAALGGSDYHGLSALGYCRSVVLARERSAGAVVEAIREGRAVAAGPDGVLDGDPALVKRLNDAGYRVRPSRHDYGAASPVAQVLAWVSLVVLLAGLAFRRVSGLGSGEPLRE